MNNYFREISASILSLHRYSKRIIALLTDAILCILCTWFAYILRLEKLVLFKDFDFLVAIISIVIALPIFWIFGSRTIFRYTSLSIIVNILTSTFVYGLLFFLLIKCGMIESQTTYYSIIPRSIGVFQPMLLFFAIIISRLGVKYLLIDNYNFGKTIKKEYFNLWCRRCRQTVSSFFRK